MPMTEWERLNRLVNSFKEDWLNENKEGNLADYLIENGVILPPVKVGDIVYVVFKQHIYPVTVSAVKIDTKTNAKRFCVEAWIQDDRMYAHRYAATYKWESVGKTVFLTQEEAENAFVKRSLQNDKS